MSDQPRTPAQLADGRYEAFVVWVDELETGDAPQRVTVDLTITTGAHKGDIVSITGPRFTRRDPLDLVGLPCTLFVEAGTPRLEL